jgi:hypothetical protein
VKRLILCAALAGGCVATDADTLDGSLASLTFTPAATSRNVFTVDVSGALAVRYTSPEPAVVEISVDGAVVLTQSLDVSSALSVNLTATVPLHAGPNQIVAAAHYQGETLSQQVVVNAAMTAPTITLPTWTSTYTAHQGLVARGTITVAADAAYAVVGADVSVDGGPWQPATSDGAGGWAAAIVNPDIGASDVAVRVTTAVDGATATTDAHGTLTIAPVFDCTSPTSMLPSNNFIQNNGTEQRVLAGYFGRPDGGHSVAFVLSFIDDVGVHYTSVGSTLNYGIAELEAAFNVSRGRCQNNQTSCSLSYDLAVLVDGAPLCNQPAFGQITRFN